MSDITADNTQSSKDVQVARNALATITHLSADKRIVLSGLWTLTTLGDVWAEVQNTLKDISNRPQHISVDARSVGETDISGAWAIRSIVQRLEQSGCTVELLADEKLDGVFSSIDLQRQASRLEVAGEDFDGVGDFLGGLGRLVVKAAKDVRRALYLFGAAMLWVVTFSSKGGLRPRSIASHFNTMGIGAIPIVALSCFLVGGVIAQQAAYQLRWFGAEMLAVDLSAYMIFRELAVLIAAIMVAGRSASAMAAEIGAMKMREEVDAMSVMGLDPIAVLVVPRMVALILVMPMLTVVASIFSLVGASTLIGIYSGFSYELYFDRMRDFIRWDTVVSGLIKAPFMAVAIGVIGCMEGLKVKGSTESLGRRTTSAVVKAVFAVFVIDGFFAIFFAALEFG